MKILDPQYICEDALTPCKTAQNIGRFFICKPNDLDDHKPFKPGMLIGMKIVIGCSMKYRSLVRDIVEKLSELELTPLFPNLDYSQENTDKANTLEEKKRLAMEHYKAIDEADIVYLVTPGGYMGTSCKLELGYAVAQLKPIYFSEPTKDVALDCYATGFVGTDALAHFLEVKSAKVGT